MKLNNAPLDTISVDSLVSAKALLRTRDVVALLNVNRKTLDRLIASGRLPLVRLGKDFRFTPAAVHQLIASSTVGKKQKEDNEDSRR
jgi:excisionase family DNA binding protein